MSERLTIETARIAGKLSDFLAAASRPLKARSRKTSRFCAFRPRLHRNRSRQPTPPSSRSIVSSRSWALRRLKSTCSCSPACPRSTRATPSGAAGAAPRGNRAPTVALDLQLYFSRAAANVSALNSSWSNPAVASAGLLDLSGDAPFSNTISETAERSGRCSGSRSLAARHCGSVRKRRSRSPASTEWLTTRLVRAHGC